jgi:hypothetical protein
MRIHDRTARGVTILEILVAIFVMLIGVTGVISLFPVGVRLSEMSADDVISSMTAQHALAAVRCEPGLRARLQIHHEETNPDGDVLGWTTNPAYRGIEGINGTVHAVGDPLAKDHLQPTFPTPSGDPPPPAIPDVRTLDLKADSATNYGSALLLMMSGDAKWKLYRLTNGSSLSEFDSTTSGCTVFAAEAPDAPSGDRVEAGDAFRLIGARSKEGVWATVPAGFFGTPAPPTAYALGAGVVDGYGYLAIVTRREGSQDTYRVDILIYKGYDATLPPEGNHPAIACYTTILSGDMLW